MISYQLLQADFTAAEIEAIVAAVLARLVVSASYQLSNPGAGLPDRSSFNQLSVYGPGSLSGLAKVLGFDSVIADSLRREFYGNPWPELMLLQDTWAARLTKNPKALKNAIAKSCDLLKDKPVEAAFSDPLVFVEPVYYRLDRHRWYWATYRNPQAAQQLATARGRDRIIQLRLENLDCIEQGMSQPFAEVRDGTPVTKPPGWE